MLEDNQWMGDPQTENVESQRPEVSLTAQAADFQQINYSRENLHNQPAYKRVVDALTKADCEMGEWERFRCPVCRADADPSFSLKISTKQPSKDRGVKVRCHNGCPSDIIVQAIGLTFGQLYDVPRDSKDGPTGPAFLRVLELLRDAGCREDEYGRLDCPSCWADESPLPLKITAKSKPSIPGVQLRCSACRQSGHEIIQLFGLTFRFLQNDMSQVGPR